MLKSEKKALKSFLVLYLGSNILFLLLGGFYYYKIQIDIQLDKKFEELKQVKQKVMQELLKNSDKIPKIDGYEIFLVDIKDPLSSYTINLYLQVAQYGFDLYRFSN